ncbi:hypothetical protein LWI28_007537 [Acer negundo]|uniref:Uncharacterized protein n=1 Tax=Acer negundo TaxID=4023 RepID=A0AAD5J8J0_ACENE|nr:hypothetical protein LWI28_007537 [Acer negundo]
MTASNGYIGNGYWNDLRIANSFERIRAIFNNGVYELVKKDEKLKYASVEKLQLQASLKQHEVSEGALKKSLATVETKALTAIENLSLLSLTNGQLETNMATVELKCSEL